MLTTAEAIAGMVRALKEIGACSPTVAWRDCCDTCLRRLVDCDGSVSSDRCPGKKARNALEALRSRTRLGDENQPSAIAEIIMWSTSNYETTRGDNMRETLQRIDEVLFGPVTEGKTP